MSEKLYSWLWRLYPSRFRAAYGDEALQLFRDRLRDERGFLLRLRLWLDLLADLAQSLPRQHSRAQPVMAAVPGAPMFYLIDSRPLRPQRWCAGAVVTLLAAFALLSFARLGHTRLPDLSHFMPGQDGPHFAHGPAPQMPPDAVTRDRAGKAQPNCTFEKVEMLPHNIGYLKLDSFPEPSVCRNALTAAMSSLNTADALIFDLRDSRGVSAETVNLVTDKPVYILTSRR
jgi:hypothetical protein